MIPHDWVVLAVDDTLDGKVQWRQCARCNHVARDEMFAGGSIRGWRRGMEMAYPPPHCPRGDMTEDRAALGQT